MVCQIKEKRSIRELKDYITLRKILGKSLTYLTHKGNICPICYMEREFQNSTEHSENTGLSQVCESDIENEKYYTRKELAKLLNVSTKTLIRWEERGMITRQNERTIILGKKRGVAYTKEEVKKLFREYSDEVKRAANFTQMTEDDIYEIIVKVKKYLTEGAKKGNLFKILSEETGRSIETIRYTVRNAANNDAELSDLLGREQNPNEIFSAFLSGDSIKSIASDFQISIPKVNKIIRELLSLWISKKQDEFRFIPNDEFERIQHGSIREEEVLADTISSGNGKQAKNSLRLSEIFGSMTETPLLTKDQEVHLFRKMNYLKYQGKLLCAQVLADLERNRRIDYFHRLIQSIKDIESKIIETKNHIIKANLRLVLSIAKRQFRKSEQEFFELVSDGSISLYSAVDKFDFARGNKFSTYASWALIKNFLRTTQNDKRHSARFQNSDQSIMEYIPDTSQSLEIQETNQELVESCTNLLREVLDEREDFIIMKRFGLDGRKEPMTFIEIGKIMGGITRERVRQIEARAIGKLRRSVKENPQIAQLLDKHKSFCDD